MGLVISVCSGLKEIQRLEDIEEHYENGDIVIDNCGFIYQLGTLKEGKVYQSTIDYPSIKAGSYSSYNRWREQLLSLVSEHNIDDYWKENEFFINYEYNEYQLLIREKKLNRILENGEKREIKNLKNLPFVELIYFSDCEGYIGPEVCKKLYQDFKKYDEQAKKLDFYFYDLYESFMKSLSIPDCVLCFN